MLSIQTSKTNPIVVVGDGWAALGTVAFLAQAGKDLCWIKGTGTRMMAPTPSVEVGESAGMGLQAWMQLARSFGLECGEPSTGCFLREFRNKAFREPTWTKAPTPQARIEVRNESLWAPECRIAPAFEARLELTLPEIEEPVRAKLLSGEFKNVRRIEDLPVLSVTLQDDQVRSVMLGSGEVIECAHFVYADRWGAIRDLQGLPAPLQKAVLTSRKREPMSVIQATFTHSVPMALGVSEGFYTLMNKEAGEETDRHVWGYFSSDGMRSFWTLCLSRDEVEDNHGIAKKLRRMKSALDKMFAGTSWLPEGAQEFMTTVSSEHVRFEEAYLYSENTLAGVTKEIEPLASKLKGLTFLTDGFGPALAFHQIAMSIETARAPGTERTDPQTEDVDASGTAPVES